MAQPLETAVEQIVTVLRDVSGLRQVPINPPETVSVGAFAIVYPFSGSIGIAPVGAKRSLHSIAIDVLTKRTDMARNFITLKPLIDLVATALISEVADGGTLFNQSINTYGSLSYVWMASEYGGVSVVGYHFLMNDVKILVNL